MSVTEFKCKSNKSRHGSIVVVVLGYVEAECRDLNTVEEHTGSAEGMTPVSMVAVPLQWQVYLLIQTFAIRFAPGKPS